MRRADDEFPSAGLSLQTIALLPFFIIFLVILLWSAFFFPGSGVIEKGINIEYPYLAKDAALSPGTIQIDIAEDGTVSIDGVRLAYGYDQNLFQLREHLLLVSEAVINQGGLVVQAHPQARFDRLIDVLSAVTGSGIQSYSLR